jgi:hypothetical protein
MKAYHLIAIEALLLLGYVTRIIGSLENAQRLSMGEALLERGHI